MVARIANMEIARQSETASAILMLRKATGQGLCVTNVKSHITAVFAMSTVTMMIVYMDHVV